MAARLGGGVLALVFVVCVAMFEVQFVAICGAQPTPGAAWKDRAPVQLKGMRVTCSEPVLVPVPVAPVSGTTSRRRTIAVRFRAVDGAGAIDNDVLRLTCLPGR